MINKISVNNLSTASSNAVVNDEFMWLGIGGVTSSGAEWRCRPANENEIIQFIYSENSDFSAPSGFFETSGAFKSTNDKTTGTRMTSLSGNTQYFYNVEISGTSFQQGSFKTAVASGTDANEFIICFGACQSGSNSNIWSAISGQSPDMFIHLGDLGYPDTITRHIHIRNWEKQFLEDTRFTDNILANMPCERIWDDHDFGENDSDNRISNKEIRLNQWLNFTPHQSLAYGDSSTSGLFRSFYYGDVHLFMLDHRYNRDQNNIAALRFPSSSTNTADAGTSSSTLILKSADSPSATDDIYNGAYLSVSGVYSRITNYVGSTRTCTINPPIVNLLPEASYAINNKSIHDGNQIDNDQIDWFLGAVSGSASRWKIIVSPTTWNSTVTNSDTFGGYDSADKFEWNYLVQELSGVVNNIIVVSSDLHFGAIDGGEAAPFPEITASPLNRFFSSVDGTWTSGTFLNQFNFGKLRFYTESSTNYCLTEIIDISGITQLSGLFIGV